MAIIDKMMRIAGRSPDGKAKAIQTDIDGNIYINSGNKVENIYLNQKYTTNQLKEITVPANAKGFIALFAITSLSGTSPTLEVRVTNKLGPTGNERISMAGVTASNTRGTICWYPGATVGDAITTENKLHMVCGCPVGDRVIFELYIGGNFDTGEGIGLTMSVRWIM